jgi:hypothetical protein
MNTEFAGGERGDNEALSAQTKALLDIDPTALFICAFTNCLFAACTLSALFSSLFRAGFSADFPHRIGRCPLAPDSVFLPPTDACKALAAGRGRPLHSPFTGRWVGALTQQI